MDQLKEIHSLDRVARAFSETAPTYDSFERFPVTLTIRRRIYSIVESLTSPRARILDINCGTGTDALYLHRRGFDVVGVDIARGMIEQARQKARQEGTNIPFFVSSFTDLQHIAKGPFDLVLSNFGGINCVEDLSPVARAIAAVTRVSGYLVVMVMPRFSLWEFASGLLHGNMSLATRRLKGHALATLAGEDAFPVFYHSLHAIRKAFSPFFKVTSVTGINIVTPPPTSRVRYNRVYSILSTVDRLVEALPVLRMMGDHALIILQRRIL